MLVLFEKFANALLSIILIKKMFSFSINLHTESLLFWDKLIALKDAYFCNEI